MSEILYDTIGVGYADYRRPDSRIAAAISAALGDARTVLNVGAGSGSYEPTNRGVVALEPSAAMIAQRRTGAASVVRAVAGELPFRDGEFDAVMASLTIHHWPDPELGLREMRRVARDRVVLFTWDPQHAGFWLVQDYFPEFLEIDRKIFQTMEQIDAVLSPIEVREVLIPWDCTDGFLGAYWRRPEMYLDPDARRAISSFAKVQSVEAGLQRLALDVVDGTWGQRHQALLDLPALDIGYRLVIARR